MRGWPPVSGPGARSPLGVSASAVERSAEWRRAVLEQQAEREQMVRSQVAARGIDDARVLEALRSVPRHRFVPQRLRHVAYTDAPLPIPGDQTISQPYIVACMTEAARVAPSERCLEIGTGSGYQTAVLAELCREVYSVEYLPEVAAFGRRNLAELGYLERRVSLRVADGSAGWPEQAPFDVILVTAAPPNVPRPLLEQLTVGGRLVIPVGVDREQNLETWTRHRTGDDDAAFERHVSFGVRFVPFLGAHGQ
jgi:protein-L-isoaspartate(D-aspartate) O-methyltransferase